MKKKISEFLKTYLGKTVIVVLIIFVMEIVTEQITLYGFRQIEMGMNYEEVDDILWGGREISLERSGSTKISIRAWTIGLFGDELNIHFKNKRVAKKTLIGRK